MTWVVRHQDWVFPIGIAILARLLISLVGMFAITIAPIQEHLDFYNYAIVPLNPVGLNLLIAPMERWDVLWYEIIATRGYSAADPSAAYFPLFPLLIRLFSPTPFVAPWIGNFLATLCTVGAFVLTYRITARLFDAATARLAIVTWAVFPSAFYLFIPYAEALSVFLTLGSLEAARQNKWGLAGLIGGLGAMTRPTGVWLVIPLAVAWFQQARAWNWAARLRNGVALFLVPLGVAVYMLHLQLAFGDALLWVHVRTAWNNYFSLPWQTIALTMRQILSGDTGALLNNLLDLGATVFVLGFVIWGLLPTDLRTLTLHGWHPRLPLSFGIYGLLFTILPLTIVSYGFDNERIPMMNAARRAIVIFPAFMLAGRYLQGRFRAPVWISVSLGVQTIFVFIFARWLWVD